MTAANILASAPRLGEGPVHQENTLSEQSRRHIELRRQVLKDHPEAAALASSDPRGLLGALAILAIYWTSVWLVSQTNVLVVFLAAFFFGQLALHSAGALLHETAHRLVFRDRRAKLGFDLLLEVIMTSFAKQLTYQHEHVSSHHPHLGNYERDYEHERFVPISGASRLSCEASASAALADGGGVICAGIAAGLHDLEQNLRAIL